MKFQASLKTLGFAVAMAASSMSYAADTNWGTVTPGSTLVKLFSGSYVGPFEDKYSFSLLTEGDGALKRNVTVTLDDLGVQESGFSGLAYGLYTSANVLIASTFEAATKTYLYSTLAAGSYYLKVSGTGWTNGVEPSPAMPRYNGLAVISASAMPEPETYAMFLAGLGIVATVVRRRSRSF
jgi:hypothetical protein